MDTPKDIKDELLQDELLQEYNTNFNLDKMKLAVDAPYYMLPKGLTLEEFNTWIKSKVTKS